MHSISLQTSDGVPVALILSRMEEQDILNESQLKHLEPYVVSLINAFSVLETARGQLTIEVLSSTQAAFSLAGIEASSADCLLSKIAFVCESIFARMVVVLQYIAPGIALAHYPMRFTVGDNRMYVQYKQFGELNTFTHALAVIESYYPQKRLMDTSVLEENS